MASIFLSYSRDDAAKVDGIAQQLEEAGHAVWWDRRIGAGSRFSKEIDAALKRADLVVVFWSKSSIDSAWVQDEAAAGRDSGRLVPVLIDKVSPPLGFRQYQSINLARSRGPNANRPLLEGIAARVGEAHSAPPRSRVSWSWPRVEWKFAALAAVLVLLVAGGLFYFPRSNADTHTIAIAAAGMDKESSEELARSVALDLGRYRVGPMGSLTILRGNDKAASGADYRVEVGVSGGNTETHIDLALTAKRDSVLLWSATLTGRADRLVDLRQQIVASLGSVLSCLSDVQSQQTKISKEVLGLYLNGCSRLADTNLTIPGEDALGIFRQITEKAPDFAPGWAYLTLLQVQSYPSIPSEEHHQLTLSARANLKRAKEIDPTLPAVFAADAYLPEHFFNPSQALAILEDGLKQHPNNALLHDARSNFLSAVGRTEESIREANSAMQLDPLTPALRDAYISNLAYAGRIDAAYKQLEDAESIWPGSSVLREVRYRLDLRYGDPRNALRLLRESGSSDLTRSSSDPAWQKFLEARIDPGPRTIEAALDAFRDRSRKGAGDWGYLQALGTFNRVDEAYQALESDEAIEGFKASTDAFFRVHMRPVYTDPRFMRVAQRMGLLEYWNTSGRWPDICRDPKLPYDCKKLAAQLTRAKVI